MSEKKIRKRKAFSGKTLVLLSAAGLLLLGSTVGSARAALTYYSENYVAGVEMSSIGITLLENGTEAGVRNYDKNGAWMTSTEELLKNLSGENEKIVPGKHYEEKLTVKNSGNIDSYVRVIVTAGWRDKEGKNVPVTTLDPNLIDLHVTEENGWTEDPDGRTDERKIWYLNRELKAGESVDFSDYLRLRPEIQNQMTEKVEQQPDGTAIHVFSYAYDGYEFRVNISAEAVQTHNGADAVKSAWGVDLSRVMAGAEKK